VQIFYPIHTTFGLLLDALDKIWVKWRIQKENLRSFIYKKNETWIKERKVKSMLNFGIGRIPDGPRGGFSESLSPLQFVFGSVNLSLHAEKWEERIRILNRLIGFFAGGGLQIPCPFIFLSNNMRPNSLSQASRDKMAACNLFCYSHLWLSFWPADKKIVEPPKVMGDPRCFLFSFFFFKKFFFFLLSSVA
jgi:hypothetical protein